MATFCQTHCTPNVPVRLAEMPCPTCPDSPAQPPPQPGEPVEEFNAPPSVNSLDPDAPTYFRAGTGIPAEYSTVGTDSVIELFLAPLIAANSAIGPSVDGEYDVTLNPGQQLAMVFGATLLAPFRITSLYDVDLTVTAGGDSTTLALVRDTTTSSGYRWTDGASYNIIDSEGNAGQTTVQNVTRLTYLVSGGLLPPAATDPGQSTWVLTATHHDTGESVVATVVVNVA